MEGDSASSRSLPSGTDTLTARDGVLPWLMAWKDIQNDPQALASVQWAGVKKLDRAVYKLAILYSGRVSHLHDLVRQRIIFDNLEDLRACVEAISKNSDLDVMSLRNHFDERYDARHTAGYRDVVLRMRVRTEATIDLGLSGHVVELQLAHRKMAMLLNPQQHARYLDYKGSMYATPRILSCISCISCIISCIHPPSRSRVARESRQPTPARTRVNPPVYPAPSTSVTFDLATVHGQGVGVTDSVAVAGRGVGGRGGGRCDTVWSNAWRSVWYR